MQADVPADDDDNRVLSSALEGLPADVATALTDFVTGLRLHFGDRLSSVVLFGSAAEARLRATSDVNVLVVARAIDQAPLDAVRDVFRAGRSAVGLTAMFIEPDELPRAHEAFAVKFADIRARHRLLYGAPVFNDIHITREAAIRRLQQVLLNLTLRLRERYAADGDRDELLVAALAEATGPVRAATATLAWLRDGREVSPREALEEYCAAAPWRDVLTSLTRLRRGEPPGPLSTRVLYGQFLRLLQTLAGAALELGPR